MNEINSWIVLCSKEKHKICERKSIHEATMLANVHEGENPGHICNVLDKENYEKLQSIK